MMNNRRFSNILVVLFMLMVMAVIVPLFSSCGKNTNVNPTTLNIQYQVVNLSPDGYPLDLFINFNRFNTTGSYFYPMPSGYVFLTSIDTPFQIRPNTTTVLPGTVVSSANLFNIDDILKPGLKYTLFITGLRSNNSQIKIFTVDTAANPSVGRGKIRFVNASPGSTGLSVTANGSVAFDNLLYPKISNFIELPSGSYDLKIYPPGSPGNTLKDIPNFTILDGRLYTLYAYGLAGHTDSLAFGANVITVPIK